MGVYYHMRLEKSQIMPKTPGRKQADNLDIAERRIQEALKEHRTTLGLSGLGLGYLPERLGELIELKELHLFNNRLTSFPGSLIHLTSLQ